MSECSYHGATSRSPYQRVHAHVQPMCNHVCVHAQPCECMCACATMCVCMCAHTQHYEHNHISQYRHPVNTAFGKSVNQHFTHRGTNISGTAVTSTPAAMACDPLMCLVRLWQRRVHILISLLTEKEKCFYSQIQVTQM